jgi:hypothetical protein
MKKNDEMRSEYRREDLGTGVRGKHHDAYQAGTNVALLDAEVLSFVEQIARRRNTDISTVVNELIKNDRRIAEYVHEG